jgi:RHS repeat-associated protein
LTGGNTYGYDANGNQTSRKVNTVTYNLTYDAENRLTGISGTGLSASYTYDGDGNRVKSVVGSTTTHYIGNYYEVINPGASQVVKKYYYAGGTRVAMSDNGVVRYFVTDHLGSTTKLINTDGSEYSDMSYLAWGSDRLTPPAIGTSFKYTGQRQAEAGLYFYNARWYDPQLGRFVQADTVIPSPGNPLAWDRYAYTMNNPINYIDPSGHIMTKCNDKDCGGSQMEENTQAANNVIVEFQAEIQSCSENCGAGALLSDVYNEAESVSDETRAEVLKYGATVYDYLEYLDMVKIPGVSAYLDYEAQKHKDRGIDYTYSQREVRAVAVAAESQLISSVSTYAGVLATEATIISGPGAPVVGVITYTGISVSGSAIFDSINDQYIFPWIDNNIK